MDWNKIEQLLNIGKAVSEHGAKYTPIAVVAQFELNDYIVEAQKIIDDKTKADAEEAGRQRAEAENKARADEEKAHADIQARDEQQAADRQAKIDSDAKAAADAGNVGDAAKTPVVRRV